jgi:hypothetical protein
MREIISRILKSFGIYVRVIKKEKNLGKNFKGEKY